MRSSAFTAEVEKWWIPRAKDKLKNYATRQIKILYLHLYTRPHMHTTATLWVFIFQCIYKATNLRIINKLVWILRVQEAKEMFRAIE
jgi:hypothetical protein